MPTRVQKCQSRLEARVSDLLRKAGKLLEFAVRVIQFSLTRGPRQQRKVPDLVISFTSIPERIGLVWMTVESILRQTVVPEKFILVLSEDQFPEKRIPRSLSLREERGLTILFEQGDRGSYKKLLPVLDGFPDHSIITVDDDVLYRKEMVQRFLEIVSDAPKVIVGSRGRKLGFDGEAFNPYSSWPLATPLDEKGIVLTGHGGIFYPAGAFDKLSPGAVSMGNDRCPNADDIWFWAMALAADRSRIVTEKEFAVPNFLMRAGKNLYRRNILPNGNDKHVVEALNHFGVNWRMAADA